MLIPVLKTSKQDDDKYKEIRQKICNCKSYSAENIMRIAEFSDDSYRVGILPARKYKGWVRCPSRKTIKIILQLCNAV